MALPAFPQAMAMTAIQLGIVLAPIAIYGAVKRSKLIVRVSAVTFILVAFQAAILFTESYGALNALQYNWLQKLFVFLSAILLCKPLGLTPKECGYFLPNRKKAFLFALLIGLIYAVLDSVATAEHIAPSIETLLFQLSMPGLQEEPFYRGLLLCYWDKHLGRPWKVLGVDVGTGCLITTAVFTVGHLVGLDKNWALTCSNDLVEWINFVVFCFVMCWIRYKFDSVWPCVLAHNADNGFAKLISLAIARLHPAG